ncbi:MAG: methyltransferase domain-containing protein, partial [Clostridia bacterium]
LPIAANTILDLFNDFIVTSQIIHTLINNGKEDLPNMMILDAGCGNGRMLRKMCELGARPINCDGIDLSHDVVEYARLNSPEGIYYFDGDIKNMPFNDAKYDIIFNFGVLIHILDDDYIREIAKEFYRVLKPGGLVFITVANEGVTWNDKPIKNMTRNFKMDDIKEMFNMFQCLGIHNAYSDRYAAEDKDTVLSYSHILRAFEMDA